jgi:hypothetical protein
MKTRYILKLVLPVLAAAAWAATAQAQCGIAHTHIGVNPTWRPADWSEPGQEAIDLDPTDDAKLWLFSVPPVHPCATPGWPRWEQTDGSPFLVLTPLTDGGEHIGKPDDPNKVLYTCSFTYSKSGGYGDPNGLQHLDGWYSAHGPQGAWNLESVDEGTVPLWDIYVRRERISPSLDEDDFFMLLPDDTPTLEKDEDVCALGKRWLADKSAWGLHEHMGYYFWLDETDEDVYVVFSAHDAGGVYQRSADFVVHFAKRVIQPIPGDLNGDGIVDVQDLEVLLDYWGWSGIFDGEAHEPHDHSDDHSQEG